jgi:hypothetical protein
MIFGLPRASARKGPRRERSRAKLGASEALSLGYCQWWVSLQRSPTAPLFEVFTSLDHFGVFLGPIALAPAHSERSSL